MTFPEAIRNLPEADISLRGCRAHLAQGDNHQILFMEFEEDVELSEHSHAAQWGMVLEGEITLNINGIENTYTKGDKYYIPAGIKHSGKIYAGYADITFFDEKSRYKIKTTD